jgi:putative transposase
MSRSLRIEYPGAFYHITSRGNARQNIFKTKRDYVESLNILNDNLKRYNWECYAYCLMSNHYHLLIKTLDPNLAQGMRQLNGVYTQKFNYLHKTVGHVFQGRYNAVLIDEDKYFYELVRYIVLNPVKAKIVKNPDNYQWSSHREMIGNSKDNICNIEKVLKKFQNIKEYKKYINQKTDETDVWEDLKGGLVLGSFEFVDKIKEYIKKERKISRGITKEERYVGRPKLKDIFNNKNAVSSLEERNRLIYKAHIEHAYSLSEIGRYIELDNSTVSRIVKKQFNAENKT